MIFCANPNAQFKSYQTEIEEAVLAALRCQRYILGEQVAALEEEFARYIGVSSGIGVGNGTDAIEIALRSLDIGCGDEVITVSHTAVATVAAIEAAGATPVFVDVDPEFYGINPAQLSEVLSSKTKAVIAVHLYGQAVDLDAVLAFCNENDLYLIEDVSQAHGARWRGRRLGSIGHIGCFSCYPTKNLGALGDAGLIVTDDTSIANKIRQIREYGWASRYVSTIVGRNSRLDELQAAILRVKLRHLDDDNELRQSLANAYSSGLIGQTFEVPKVRKHSDHVFHLYVLRVSQRDDLVKYLGQNEIFAGVHYPLPVHQQPAYLGRIRCAEKMDVTDCLAHEVISLPLYPELTLEQSKRVIDVFNSYQDARLGE
jgi:dTDP-4-amino-4,6-dideoxygalactose transaminase